jgi:hypothetical protein
LGCQTGHWPGAPYHGAGANVAPVLAKQANFVPVRIVAKPLSSPALATLSPSRSRPSPAGSHSRMERSEIGDPDQMQRNMDMGVPYCASRRAGYWPVRSAQRSNPHADARRSHSLPELERRVSSLAKAGDRVSLGTLAPSVDARVCRKGPDVLEPSGWHRVIQRDRNRSGWPQWRGTDQARHRGPPAPAIGRPELDAVTCLILELFMHGAWGIQWPSGSNRRRSAPPRPRRIPNFRRRGGPIGRRCTPSARVRRRRTRSLQARILYRARLSPCSCSFH